VVSGRPKPSSWRTVQVYPKAAIIMQAHLDGSTRLVYLELILTLTD